MRIFLLVFACGCLVSDLHAEDPGSRSSRGPLTFNADVRPILSDKCFHCHGPDASTREADLRLDEEADATRMRDGGAVLNRQAPKESLLLQRITSTGEDRMPPPDHPKPLTPDEIKILTRWVNEGATWQRPWAYVTPVRNPDPAVTDNSWPVNFIDRFVLHRIEQEGLHPSPDTDRVTLIRRVTFDLTGLPPTPQQVADFVNDSSPDAYQKVVDRLLASDECGERLAIWWLDLVRFADTVGYHGDQDHNISPYRDYVIEAFISNRPFDQFSMDQLAGDWIENADEDQKIAASYNRLLQTTHEGGLQEKEYLAIYGADRVRNVSGVWFGATIGCAQCHDHKFDPYTAKDFYSMEAFFADIDEERHFREGTNSLPARRPPEEPVLTRREREHLAGLQKQFDDVTSQLTALGVTYVPEKPPEKPADKKAPAKKVAEKKAAAEKKPAGKKQPAPRAAESKPAQATEPAVDSAVTATKEATVTTAEQNPVSTETPTAVPAVPEDPAITAKKNTLLGQARQLDAAIRQVKDSARVLMITRHKEPRTIRLLPRGNWLDDSGEITPPAVPAFLGSLSTGERRPTRLDLANWLFDTDKGIGLLTARVFANRLWYVVYGEGLSRSLEDFGGQGEPPTHPELLDRLAHEFVESGWNVRHLLRLMALSRTYQQSSKFTPEEFQRDPANRLLARQFRFRIPAEAVRDTALDLSGLLVRKVGGPSVKPYQPEGYYRHLNFPTRTYKSDDDPQKQWRRGLYVHWQRQYLHPMLKSFDAPTREECTVQRPRSNTPLASLVLLNDPSFVEAARAFAVRILKQGGATTDQRLDFAFRLATSRTPDETERQLLSDLLEQSLADAKADPEASQQLLKVGLAGRDQTTDLTETVAWTTVARAILNLGETYQRN